ncbi:hypothetical protein [Leucobacter chromiiresistens]|uniref:Uncharacterized protein n=1 Tax=Leucobacter chromiiresistens TaxID=1079994 RepID=A0A147EMP8_9MICO|nr:hypothetical protein [Leucobacter chromiiresistens]KTR85759.1 hypothetical protein NS354_07810 [Leucobacter chromiiresistens]
MLLVDWQADQHSEELRRAPREFEPSWASARRMLFGREFDENWSVRCTSILETAIRLTGREPLVLLPDDVQLEEYDLAYDVRHGEAAIAALDALAESRFAGAPERFVLVDLAPVLIATAPRFLSALQRLLSTELPESVVVAVVTSHPGKLDALPFDWSSSLADAAAHAAAVVS